MGLQGPLLKGYWGRKGRSSGEFPTPQRMTPHPRAQATCQTHRKLGERIWEPPRGELIRILGMHMRNSQTLRLQRKEGRLGESGGVGLRDWQMVSGS